MIHTSGVETYYMYDAGGNVLAIYDNNGTVLQQKEIPVYAAGRIGMYNNVSSTYQYELTDHLGNVRVVLNHNKTSAGLADVVYYSDYYPYGMPMGLASNDYRYGYQGAYAEADRETAWNAFTLRNYDAAIGRWLSVDPYGQYASPYLGMGNNPIMRVDPDGGADGDPKFPKDPVNMQVYKEDGKSYLYNEGQWSNFLSEVTFNGGQASVRPRNNDYSPWTGPDAIGVQVSYSANTIFGEINLSAGLAIDNTHFGIYGDVNGGVGFNTKRLIPAVGLNVGVSAMVRDKGVKPDLLDAITGPNHAQNLMLGPIVIGKSVPIDKIGNNKIIHGRGYTQYSFGVGEGLGYSENISQSSGFVFNFSEIRGQW